MTSLEQIDSDLDAALTYEIDFDAGTEPPVLDDIDQADRAMRRVARIEHDMNRYEKLYRTRAAEIIELLGEALAPMERERDWHLRSVEGWTRAHLIDARTKTVKLPSGTVSLRSGQPKVVATAKEPDVDIADWFVRVRREWDKNAVKAGTQIGPEIEDVDTDGVTIHWAVDSDGVPVNGVVYELPTSDSFSYKAGNGDV